jgi:mRNA interferase RelE/StbE
VAYTVLLRPAAQRDLDKLSSELRIRIDRTLLAFELQPRPQGITKLAGTPDTWRVRVGDYRILLGIDDGAKTVLILRIAHRRDVYR